MNNLFDWCYGEGSNARKQPPETQAKIEQNVRNKLETVQEHEINARNIEGSFFTKVRDEALAKLNSVSEGVSIAVHRQSLMHGSFFLLLVILLLIGEFLIMTWTLSPYSLASEGILISLCITLTGMLATDKYLIQIKKVKPDSHQKYVLYMVVISLVLLLAAGMLLAHSRGVLMGSQNAGSDLKERVEVAERYYQRTSYFPFALGMIGVALSLIMGVVLHDALPRVIISGNAVMLDRKVKKADKRILGARLELQEAEAIVKKGMCEFNKGLNRADGRREGFWLSPVFILLLALLLVLLLVATARGDERESVFVLIDLSKSTLCEDYGGENDFKKNLLAVSEVIKKLEPGTEFKIIGITEDSLEKPYFLLEERLMSEKGAFGEKAARAKLTVMEKWQKMNPEAAANETDIFSALALVSFLFKSRQGKKELVVFSDLRASVGFDLERPEFINDDVFNRVKKRGLIPALEGVDCWLLGVSPCGKTSRYLESLERFWRRYFEAARARIVSFSIDREWK